MPNKRPGDLFKLLGQKSRRTKMLSTGVRFYTKMPWPHRNLMAWLRRIAEKLHRTIRWKSFYPSWKESVLVHLFTQGMIALVVVSFELRCASQKLTILDGLRIIAGSFFHDLCESESPDYPRDEKDDPEIGPRLKADEERKFKMVIAFLPMETQELIRQILDELQDKRRYVGRLFDACELIGYMFFAFEEIRNNNVAFLRPLADSWDALCERGYIRESVGVRMTLEPYLPMMQEIFDRYGREHPRSQW